MRPAHSSVHVRHQQQPVAAATHPSWPDRIRRDADKPRAHLLQERYPCFMFGEDDHDIQQNPLFYPAYFMGRIKRTQNSMSRLDGPLRILWTLSDDGLYADKLALLRRALPEAGNLLAMTHGEVIPPIHVSDAMPGSNAYLHTRSRDFGRALWDRIQPHLRAPAAAAPTLQQHRVVNALLFRMSAQTEYVVGGGAPPLDLQRWADERFERSVRRAASVDVLSAAAERHLSSLRRLLKAADHHRYKRQGIDSDDDADEAYKGEGDEGTLPDEPRAVVAVRASFDALNKKLESARQRLVLPKPGRRFQPHDPPAEIQKAFESNIERDVRDARELVSLKLFYTPQETSLHLAQQLHTKYYPRALRPYTDLDQTPLLAYTATLGSYVGQLARGSSHVHKETVAALYQAQRVLWGETADAAYAAKRAALLDGLPLCVAAQMFEPVWNEIALPVAEALDVDIGPLIKDVARTFSRQDVIGRLLPAERGGLTAPAPAADEPHVRANRLLRLVLGYHEPRSYPGFMWRALDVHATTTALWRLALQDGRRARALANSGGADAPPMPLPADVLEGPLAASMRAVVNGDSDSHRLGLTGEEARALARRINDRSRDRQRQQQEQARREEVASRLGFLTI